MFGIREFDVLAKYRNMTKKERYKKVIGWFEANAESAETELHYQNPYQLLVAVILSAQCTDRRVNLITPPLFEAGRFSWEESARVYTKVFQA
jgi:endonuclease III